MSKESAGKRIADELREYATDAFYMGDEEYVRLRIIANHIDAAHEEALSQAYMDVSDSEWVRLPKDADGEVIHAGDKLDGYGKTIEVVELRYGRSGWVLISRDGNAYADTYAFTHHHAPSVEDVLTEFAAKLSHRGGLSNGVAQTVADFAKRLRLREEGDAE